MSLRDQSPTELSVPLVSSFDPAFAQALQDLRDTGTAEIVVERDGLSESAGSSRLAGLGPGDTVNDRAGTARSDAGEFRLEYGSERASLVIPGLVAAEAQAVPVDGLQLDGIGTGRGEMSYHSSEAAAVETHPPHGGRYVSRGLRLSLAEIRAEFRRLSRPGHRIVQGATEGLAGLVDLAGESETLLPGSAYGLVASRDGNDGATPAMADTTPPLLSVVHGERMMTGRVIQPFVTAGLSTSMFHPDDTRLGITRDELTRMLSFQIACCIVNGHMPIPQVVPDLNGWRIKSTDGEQAFGLLKEAQWALSLPGYLASFLGGIAERTPPDLGGFDSGFDDGFGGGRDYATNPFSAWKKVSLQIAQRAGPPLLPLYNIAAFDDGFDEGFQTGTTTGTSGLDAGHASFQVPSILARMWRDRVTGELCLIACNWTTVAAGWVGLFDPALYGWSAGNFSTGFDAGFDVGDEFEVHRLFGGDSGFDDGFDDGFGGPDPKLIVSGIAGRTGVIFSGVEGDSTDEDIFLGAIPPCSIRAYRFRKQL